jgi:hypothetical protein
MRWALKLSEVDFVINHRAENKIPHIDDLSRHISTKKDKKNSVPNKYAPSRKKAGFADN